MHAKLVFVTIILVVHAQNNARLHVLLLDAHRDQVRLSKAWRQKEQGHRHKQLNSRMLM